MPVMMPAAAIVAVVHAVRGELRELEKRRCRDRAARGRARAAGACRARRASRDAASPPPCSTRATSALQVGDQRRHGVAVLRERGVARVELRFDDGHGRSSCARASRDARRAARTARRRRRCSQRAHARGVRTNAPPGARREPGDRKVDEQAVEVEEQPSAMNASAFDGAPASMNCGRNARKNSATFGLSTLITQRLAEDSRARRGRQQRVGRRLRSPRATDARSTATRRTPA